MNVQKAIDRLHKLADEAPNLDTLAKASVLLDGIERHQVASSKLAEIRTKFETLCGIGDADRPHILDELIRQIWADLAALRISASKTTK